MLYSDQNLTSLSELVGEGTRKNMEELSPVTVRTFSRVAGLGKVSAPPWPQHLDSKSSTVASTIHNGQTRWRRLTAVPRID